MNGKGSKVRPCDKRKYNDNFDKIFGHSDDDIKRYQRCRKTKVVVRDESEEG